MKLKSVYLGLLLALALILSYVETLIPFSVAIPGIKIGMSNLTVIWCLYLLSFREAMLLSVSKAILSGLLFGNPVMILYSLSGAVLSCLVMYILKRCNGFHVPVVSAVGGVAHNIGQLLVAFFMVQTYGIVYYIPFLLLAGLLMGGVNGSISTLVLPYLQNYLSKGHMNTFGDGGNTEDDPWVHAQLSQLRTGSDTKSKFPVIPQQHFRPSVSG